MTDLPGQATVGAAVGAVDAGRARAQGELCNTTMLTILYYITYQSVPAGVASAATCNALRGGPTHLDEGLEIENPIDGVTEINDRSLTTMVGL